MRTLFLITMFIGMCWGSSAPCWTPAEECSLANAGTRDRDLYGLTPDLCIVPPESIIAHRGKPDTVDSTRYLVYKDGIRLDSIPTIVLTYGGTKYQFGSMLGTWAMYSVVVTKGSFGGIPIGSRRDCLHLDSTWFEVYSEAYSRLQMYPRDNMQMLLEYTNGNLTRSETVWVWTWFEVLRTYPKWNYDLLGTIEKLLREP